VDDQLLMRELHGIADTAEQDEPIVNGDVAGRAVFVKGLAIDVLHDDVGHAFVDGAAVIESGNVGVIESGEDLALVAEAGPGRGFIGVEPQDFEGHVFAELIVVAVGQKHSAHAAAAKQFADPIGSNAAPDPLLQLGRGLSIRIPPARWSRWAERYPVENRLARHPARLRHGISGGRAGEPADTALSPKDYHGKQYGG